MKKTFTFLSLVFFGFSLSAQMPIRTSLYEEFTGENCGPCLSTNWTLDSILLNNSSLVIPIKWQVPLLTAPTNTWSIYQTNKAEINWRYRSSTGSTLTAGPSTLAYGYPSQNTATNVATNGINLLASGRLDGQHQWAFGATSDDPVDINNLVILSAQSQTTNFRVDMTPSWSPTFTNCVVSVTVSSATSFTSMGALMFRLCLVERLISFPTPPGINGEKVFREAVRQSYPTTIVNSSVTAMGTPLNNIWIAGQTQTFTLSCDIPSSIRDLSEMAFVGFVQDDGDRLVYQAARTAQPAVPNDIKALALNIPLSCTSAFTPSLIVQNLGQSAITTLTIAPYIDGLSQPPINYTVNIVGGAIDTIALPTYTALYGSHTFSATITNVGGGDLNPINNTKRVVFGISSSTLPGVAEPFSSFPPAKWYNLNYNFTPGTWVFGGPSGFGVGVGSAKYDFWNNYEWGDYDDLFMPALNLSSVSNVVLSFDVAYAQYTDQSDKLDVFVSNDCGASWTNVFAKNGALLATAPSYSVGPFVPNATQWRKEVINLPAQANQPLVLLKFRATADYGNNLYIDSVKIGNPIPTNTNSITENNKSEITCELYPNPTSGFTNLSISLIEIETADITIINSIGQLVYSLKNNKLDAGVNIIRLNTESFSSGVYFINVSTTKGFVNTKLSITK
ncbi:MAG: T9SS type A sorting domain-containing protein [Bacteroidota bacterium]|nr:T9SS type A sorting domain-containing protein [Bacteroidota bacterium]